MSPTPARVISRSLARYPTVARPLVALFTFWLALPLWAGDQLAREQTALEGVAARIDNLAQAAPVTVLGEPLLAREALTKFYRARDHRLAWLDAGHRQQLLEALERVGDEGLRPSDYHGDLLSELLARPFEELSDSLRADLDLLLSDAFLMLASHLHEGKVNPRTLHAEWTANRWPMEMHPVLSAALERSDLGPALAAQRPQHRAYQRLVLARQELTRLLGEPWLQLAAGASIKPGDRDPRLPEIRRRLRLLGDLSTEPGRDQLASHYGDDLLQVIPQFQARHGLEPDGVIGRNSLTALNLIPLERLHRIDAALERWRWLPAALGDRYVLVNIAGYELTMVDQGREVLRKRVIVGQPFRQTPVFSDRIRYLVFNPTWTIPRSLMIEDHLPRIVRDPGYLSRMGIDVFQGWGANQRQVDPGAIDWRSLSADNFPYQLIQAPGPKNALGRVKFMFPNPYSVYLHDTPGQGMFGRSSRSFSAGCIRVEQPLDLAEQLLAGDAQWSRQRIDSALTGTDPVTARLSTPVPVYLQYWTAWVDQGGQVQYRNDIYNRDNRLISRLKEAPAPGPSTAATKAPARPGA